MELLKTSEQDSLIDVVTLADIKNLQPGTDVEVQDGKSTLPFKVTSVHMQDEVIAGDYYVPYFDKGIQKFKIIPGRKAYHVPFSDYILRLIQQPKPFVLGTSSRYLDFGVQFLNFQIDRSDRP